MEEMSSAAQPLSDNDRKYILRAEQDKFEDGGIVRYYEQAIQKKVHEDVIAAIELRMRTDFPKAARQVFGAKGEQAEEMLARVQEAVQARYDLSGNALGNHIKVGGDELRAGAAYLYRYLSYKASGQQYGAQMSLIQADPAAELRVKVRYYRAHAGADNMEELQWFAASDMDAATQAYLALLDKLAVPLRQQA
jgi:hypothetical protein